MENVNVASDVLKRGEGFWEDFDAPRSPYELLRYSAVLALLPLAGFLIWYAAVGKIWNYWPLVRTFLSVKRAVMCAGLQWFFFATFPIISSMILRWVFGSKRFSDTNDLTVVCTYSMSPLYLAALFVAVPFFGRIFVILSLASFLYLLYYGYRIFLKQSVFFSAVMAFLVAFLFAVIRQMFVFVIGF